MITRFRAFVEVQSCKYFEQTLVKVPSDLKLEKKIWIFYTHIDKERERKFSLLDWTIFDFFATNTKFAIQRRKKTCLYSGIRVAIPT